MPAPKQFNPKDVIVTYGGAILSGFADGTFVNVERTSDAFTMSTGADGETTRVGSADRSGTITLTFNQSSPSNDVLSLIANNDERQGNGVLPFLVKDSNGTSVFATAYAWIRKMPAAAWSKDVETREWVLDCAELEMNVGGNFEAA